MMYEDMSCKVLLLDVTSPLQDMRKAFKTMWSKYTCTLAQCQIILLLFTLTTDLAGHLAIHFVMGFRRPIVGTMSIADVLQRCNI
jgi:hypothetical protein